MSETTRVTLAALLDDYRRAIIATQRLDEMSAAWREVKRPKLEQNEQFARSLIDVMVSGLGAQLSRATARLHPDVEAANTAAILLQADTQPPAGDGPWKVERDPARYGAPESWDVLFHPSGADWRHRKFNLETEAEARAVANCLNRVASRQAASGGGER